jgi:hypothetical protein
MTFPDPAGMHEPGQLPSNQERPLPNQPSPVNPSFSGTAAPISLAGPGMLKNHPRGVRRPIAALDTREGRHKCRLTGPRLRMSMGPHTIKSQMKSIYRKLGSSTRAQTVTRARELGLLEG